MKVFKKIAVILLIGLIVFTFTGCSALIQMFEIDEMRKNTEAMLNAIIEDDIDTAYAIVDETCTKEDFIPVFDEMKQLLADTKSYNLNILSAYQNKNITLDETVTSSTATYKMTSSAGTYIVDVKIISPQTDLNSFSITPFEQTNYYSVGTVSNMSKASAFQWIILLSNIIIIGFVIFAFIDCCRQKIKLKALWLIVIALGVITVGATLTATSFKFNFNIAWLFAYNTYITYGGGMKVIRFMLPIGAIIYLIFRISMFIKAQISKNNSAITPLEQPDKENTILDDNINL